MDNQVQDLALGFKSGVTGTMQPYRLLIPSIYDGITPLPLLVALHGTGGDQNKYFDHPEYNYGIYKRLAEENGFAMLCPFGNDDLNRPTEWRGTGEIHLFEAIDDVCQRIKIDRDRIILTGQSMGGSGTSNNCCRYPGYFAVGIPLSSSYVHIPLVPNFKNIPMYFIQGKEDWPIYAKTGPIPITEEMKRLNLKHSFWIVPDCGHNTMKKSTPGVFEIASSHKLNPSPSTISHRTYFPAHGKAWWVDIANISVPGKLAQVDASINNNRIDVSLKNTDEVIIRPDKTHMNLEKPLAVYFDDLKIFEDMLCETRQIRIKQQKASIEALKISTIKERLDEPLFFMEDIPTWAGYENTFLGNLLSDVMREVTNSDIALISRGHFMYGENFRGAVPPRGLGLITTRILTDWLRPLSSTLAVAHLTGKEIGDILELNLAKGDVRFIIQVSGFSYKYSKYSPVGAKITGIDLDPGKAYKTVFKLSDITRTDTLELGDLYDNFDYMETEENLLTALWNIAHKNLGLLRFSRDKRVILES